MHEHSPEQIDRLCKLIEYQGFRNPLVIQKGTNIVVAGHGRLEAARKLNMQTVPVTYQEFESEAQLYAYIVSDNAIGKDTWASLDLGKINTDILDLGPDLDIEMLGLKDFEVEPLDRLNPQTDEDAVPDVINPITVKGDVWLLGKHRVMCGDSTMIDEVETLMNGEKADMVFTDPPYNVAFNGRSGKHDVIKNDDMAEDDFANFIAEVASVIKIINPKSYYIWCNWKFYGLLQDLFEFKSCIVWAKNVFGMGNNYRHQHEFCLFNGDIDKDIKNESDLWEIKRDSKYVHPTQKPVALSLRALANHRSYNNILDLFGGSGSTLIGCEQSKKKAFIMELDEKYCDVIIKRWEEYTGDKATLELTGQTYLELSEVRNG